MLKARRYLFWIIATFSLFPRVCTAAQNVLTPAEVSITLEKEAITEHEPVIIDIKIQSPPLTSLNFDPGYDWENIEIKVVDPHARFRMRPPPAIKEGMKFSKAVNVDSGVSSTLFLVASDWFSFEEQGFYQIEVTLLASPPLGVSAKLSLQVEQKNEEALKAECSALLSRVNKSQSFSSSLAAAQALSDIDDPTSVPYLAAAMKRREFISLMIGALTRLNTENAVNALIEASRSHDPETSSQARSALVSLGHTN